MSGIIKLIVNGKVRHSQRYNTKKERTEIIKDWKRNRLKGNEYEMLITPDPVEYIQLDTIQKWNNRKLVVRDEFLLNYKPRKARPEYSNTGHLKTIEKYS